MLVQQSAPLRSSGFEELHCPSALRTFFSEGIRSKSTARRWKLARRAGARVRKLVIFGDPDIARYHQIATHMPSTSSVPFVLNLKMWQDNDFFGIIVNEFSWATHESMKRASPTYDWTTYQIMQNRSGLSPIPMLLIIMFP